MTLSLKPMRLLFIAALLLALACNKTPTASAPAADLPDPATQVARIQGVWQSLEDTLYSITFSGDRYHSSYTGIEDLSVQYSITDSCAGAPARGSYLFFTMNEMPMCYQIERLTDRNLDLIYLQKGNTLSFIKVNP